MNVKKNQLSKNHLKKLSLINTETNSRSSRQEVFYKKGVFRNFAKFTGKRLCLRPATLLKMRLWFPVNFTKFLRTSFFTEHVWWLLLQFL